MTDFCFIDSGVGGIPYMTELLKKDSSVSCLYVADTANFPYGTKSHEEIVSCAKNLVSKIIKKFNPSVIVFACNTISVNALEVMRQTFPDTSFVGTVPAIKLAAAVSKNRRIGLIATESTCRNPYNHELKELFAKDCELVLRGDAALVSYIEHNAFTASFDDLLSAVKPAMDFFRKENCDVIILGCTHFLNIKDVFEKACGKDIKVVDSVDGVVRHALEVFKKEKPVSIKEKQTASLYVTGLLENKEYDILCKRYGINFAGKL